MRFDCPWALFTLAFSVQKDVFDEKVVFLYPEESSAAKQQHVCQQQCSSRCGFAFAMTGQRRVSPAGLIQLHQSMPQHPPPPPSSKSAWGAPCLALGSALPLSEGLSVD